MKKIKEYKRSLIVLAAIIALPFIVYGAYKLVSVCTNPGTVIYKHSSDITDTEFTFRTVVIGDNKIRLEIDHYQGRGPLLLDHPFYEAGESIFPRKRTYEEITLPEQFNISAEGLVKNKEGYYSIEIFLQDEKEYYLPEFYADYYTGGNTLCFPIIY